jgi:hypothetical protein
MINVITVKWGDKYDAGYVNRLSTMVDRYLTEPHTFYCYTDDPTGLNTEWIDVIEIPPDDLLEGWWNKVGIFNSNMPYEGRCLYLDLDTVIQSNIDDLVNYEMHKLCGVWTYWNLVYTNGDYKHATLRWKVPFNSSVMTWNASDCYWIWDYFWPSHNEYIMQYYGDDKFLGNEVTDYKTFPQEWIYSRLYGNSMTDVPTDKVMVDKHTSQAVHYYPDAKICLLNGPTTPAYYERFKDHWT